MENFTYNSKRVSDESDESLADLAESKLRRLDSTESRSTKPCTKVLAESEEIQEEFLNILEDSDAVVDRNECIHGLELDSFIRSFEEEIRALPPAKTASDRNESPQAELGYLFEASDDELGLPPTVGSSTEGKMEAVDFMPACCSPGVFELDGNLGFEDEIPSYDSFEIGTGLGSGATEGGEFALGCLFDYSDVPFRPEWLSAL